ncbi:MAG: FKBP-type peptidyl-prolyl cis-trans isomerase [Thermoplasmatota archaeon]
MDFKAGDRVMVEYTARLDDGTVVDTTENDGPAVLELGVEKVMVGFEEAIRDMEVGEEREVVIEPEKAFGDPDPVLIMDLPKEGIPEEGHFPGRRLMIKMENGIGVQGIVLDVGEDFVKIDFNHPLRGKRLTYRIVILEFIPSVMPDDQ